MSDFKVQDNPDDWILFALSCKPLIIEGKGDMIYVIFYNDICNIIQYHDIDVYSEILNSIEKYFILKMTKW